MINVADDKADVVFTVKVCVCDPPGIATGGAHLKSFDKYTHDVLGESNDWFLW